MISRYDINISYQGRDTIWTISRGFQLKLYFRSNFGAHCLFYPKGTVFVICLFHPKGTVFVICLFHSKETVFVICLFHPKGTVFVFCQFHPKETVFVICLFHSKGTVFVICLFYPKGTVFVICLFHPKGTVFVVLSKRWMPYTQRWPLNFYLQFSPLCKLQKSAGIAQPFWIIQCFTDYRCELNVPIYKFLFALHSL